MQAYFEAGKQQDVDGTRPSPRQLAHEKPFGASAAQVPILLPMKLAALIFLMMSWLSHTGQVMSGSSPANKSFSKACLQVSHWYSKIGILRLLVDVYAGQISLLSSLYQFVFSNTTFTDIFAGLHQPGLVLMVKKDAFQGDDT